MPKKQSADDCRLQEITIRVMATAEETLELWRLIRTTPEIAKRLSQVFADSSLRLDGLRSRDTQPAKKRK